MDSFSPVGFMSIFYGFLKLINFPPFVRNSWHRRKPRRRETLPTGCMSKLSCSQSRLSGGTARLPPLLLQREACQCSGEGSVLIGIATPLSQPGRHPVVPDSLSRRVSAPRAIPWVGRSRDACRAAPGLPPPAPLSKAGHRRGIWFFSASPVPGFAAKDNELNGISRWRRKGAGGECWPCILLLSLTCPRLLLSLRLGSLRP